MRLVCRSVYAFLRDDSGHALIEYLFMLSLVIFACIGAIALLGDQTLTLFQRTRDAMP